MTIEDGHIEVDPDLAHDLMMPPPSEKMKNQILSAIGFNFFYPCGSGAGSCSNCEFRGQQCVDIYEANQKKFLEGLKDE